MITIVSGFGRCGSSLVMQMLEAGGMPVSGNYPAFEHHIGNLLLVDQLTAADIRKMEGRAVKLLDPHRGVIPLGFEYRAIWMSRDHAEQARSQVKFMNILMGLHEGVETEKKFAFSYVRDEPLAIKSLRACGIDHLLFLRFEDVLSDPKKAAQALSDYCGVVLDIEKMAAVVRPRSPFCAPDLSLELSLIKGRLPVASA